MATDADFHEEMLSLYRRNGTAIGYWPHYFRRAVRNNGGLAVAKKLLAPKQTSTGFDRLVEARRVDLSVEAIVLEDRYSHLFAPDELDEARERLAQVPVSSFPKESDGPQTLGEVADSETYQEGAVQRVWVNRYERDPKARDKCIEYRGTRCAVCELDFKRRYGKIGKGFIHVHHLRPLSRLKSSYRLDPLKDLVPVCPNCHAMLHRRNPPYDIEQLRGRVRPDVELSARD